MRVCAKPPRNTRTSDPKPCVFDPGPPQLKQPALVQNQLDTVVWRYKPVYMYLPSKVAHRLNPRAGCCPWKTRDEGCCTCIGWNWCTLECVCEGCFDCSPTSWAIGFLIPGLILVVWALIYMVGWWNHAWNRDYKHLCDVYIDDFDLQVCARGFVAFFANASSKQEPPPPLLLTHTHDHRSSRFPSATAPVARPCR